ncbi:MAG: hypothetical protein JNK89_08425, partial [Saprospiraceae bacterium]|nr:hypothetical protein [Saprospiraceae bacterium]
GEQETVINSNNPPPPNTVYFGNAHTPNFSGGTPRSFDQRSVPPDEKYRFTILRGGFVNVTAYVRWTTDKDPGKYMLPQLPYGIHRIQWVINDGCGNITRCDYPIQVRDCRAPELICLNGLSVDMPVDQSITLYASDFLQYTSDNCTPNSQLLIGMRKSGQGSGFPYLPDNSPQQSVTFTCAELGAQLVELWVMDHSGNYNTCETYVIVQDNFSVCAPGKGTVAGHIKTKEGLALEDCPVQLSANLSALPPIDLYHHSNGEGYYIFPGAVPLGANLTLSPQKDNDPLNGVSTYDLALINKHILGNTAFTNPYQMIAADINGSRSITTYDIVELRKLILGIYTEFPSNTSWRFIDKTYQFPNPSNPFQEIFPETKQIANLQSNQVGEDFVAVKVGDVNGNAVTNNLQIPADRRHSLSLLDLTHPGSEWVKAGETVRLHVAAADELLGLQLTLLFPQLELLRVEPGVGMDASNFAYHAAEHALCLSWDGPGSPEFDLVFRAMKAGALSQMIQPSSRITAAEAYRETAPGQAEWLDIALRFNNGTLAQPAFEALPCAPNPWHSQTRLPFYLPAPATVRLTVTDQTGKVLVQHMQDFEKGRQQFVLDSRQVPTTGLLFYRLETHREQVSGKMIRTP